MFKLPNILYLLLQASDISVFEVNIRFVGGLLAAYALTGDAVSIVLVYVSLCS